MFRELKFSRFAPTFFPSLPSNINSRIWTVWVLFCVFIPSIRFMTRWKEHYRRRKLARTTHVENAGQAKGTGRGSVADGNWRMRWLGGPRHLLTWKLGQCMLLWGEGQRHQQKAQKEVPLSLLPVTPHSLGMDWAGVLSGRFSTQAPASCQGASISRFSLILSKGNSWNYLFLSASVPSPKVQATCGQLQLYKDPAGGACTVPPAMAVCADLQKSSQPNWWKPSLYTWDACLWIWSWVSPSSESRVSPILVTCETLV